MQAILIILLVERLLETLRLKTSETSLCTLMKCL